jgi:peptide/nickel transport system ATP-binding protein
MPLILASSLKEMTMKSNEKLLRIKDLYVDYQTDLETVHAVNGISFDLEKGETVGIVGETGAGKTTTALSILRLLPERTGKILNGSIEFMGENLLAVSEEKMRDVRGEKIAMIFQDPMTSLNPVLSVGEQIAEVLLLHAFKDKKKDEINNRTEEVLRLVGIQPERKKDYPHQFSGGMKQRVVIAMALACEPDILIADEPTTALDVTIQAQVLAMIRELKERLGTSMIMITHDLGIVAQTCDKVGVMYAGELIETGILEDIFTGNSHHPYTTGLFGSIPNLKTKTVRLSPIGGLMPDPTNLPKGCKFSPRCPKCMDICLTTQPHDAVLGTHTIKCHLFKDIKA